MTGSNAVLSQFIRERYSRDDLSSLFDLLTRHRTFAFEPLATGLFPAAPLTAAAEQSGYSHVWVRDNVHVANALLLAGDAASADRCVRALAAFYQRHRDRFERIVKGEVDPGVAEHRPPVRFDGADFSKAPEWPHAQNDALGYFLWFYCLRARANAFVADFDLLDLFVGYFERIEYWRDADNGHWEEVAKIEASSIGAVYAGLLQLRQLRRDESWNSRRLDKLIEEGEKALREILPWEAREPPAEARRYDAALLFLLYPLDIVQPAMAEQICADVKGRLQGDWGIRRYPGDSYWTADYARKWSPSERTADFSHPEQMAERNAKHRLGEEAQWCLFDPILSIAAGRRYLLGRSETDLAEQTHRFNRALNQLTKPDCAAGALQCPEAYCLEDGRYVPDPQTPLLWTQANLLSAFVFMQKSAAAREGAAA